MASIFISMHNAEIYFRRHCQSKSGAIRWVNFEIKEPGKEDVSFTIWDPHPELVRFLYTCNKPDVDETDNSDEVDEVALEDGDGIPY